MSVNICQSCFGRCDIKMVVDSFDYAGTHCTNGIGGTQHCEIEASDCCGEDFSLVDEDLVEWHDYLMLLADRKGIKWMVAIDPEEYADDFSAGISERDMLGGIMELWT